ncbi:MAG: hypothetical protein XD79_0360 [Atribacteria bacterium 34_128]|nr:MAG: hypothetical protein XD79_0360 [Atribacteria bacterium 34_128]
MGILKYIFTGNPYSVKNYQKEEEKFKKNLNKFMEDKRTKEVLEEYNFSSEKLKDIIERNRRLGIYNIIFILNRGKILWDLLDIYTKSPDDWTEEDKFIEASNLLNKYNIYK